jgi:peptide/nickel transport system permease protein
MFLRRLIRNKLAVLGAVLLLFLVTMAVLAPWVATHNPFKLNIKERFLPPSSSHFFGTDGYGRDLFSRVVYGAAIALRVGFLSIIVAMTAGILLGLISGYYRGWIDTIIMRIMDGIMALPDLLLAISFVALTKASVRNVVIALVIPQTPRVVRLVRSIVLTLREQPFIEAATAMGARVPRIMIRHLLPNTLAALIVQGTYVMASAVLIEAGLSFLGAGTPPEIPSWGNIMAEGRTLFRVFPHNIFYPAIFLAVTVLAINIMGDGLRDTLDPKMSKKV